MGLRDHDLTGCVISGFGSWNAKGTMIIFRSHVYEAIFGKLKVLEVTWILNDLCKDHVIFVLALNDIK